MEIDRREEEFVHSGSHFRQQWPTGRNCAWKLRLETAPGNCARELRPETAQKTEQKTEQNTERKT